MYGLSGETNYDAILDCPAMVALFGGADQPGARVRAKKHLGDFYRLGSAELFLDFAAQETSVAEGAPVTPEGREALKKEIEKFIEVANSCGANLPKFKSPMTTYLLIGGGLLGAFFLYRHYSKK